MRRRARAPLGVCSGAAREPRMRPMVRNAAVGVQHPFLTHGMAKSGYDVRGTIERAKPFRDDAPRPHAMLAVPALQEDVRHAATQGLLRSSEAPVRTRVGPRTPAILWRASRKEPQRPHGRRRPTASYWLVATPWAQATPQLAVTPHATAARRDVPVTRAGYLGPKSGEDCSRA